MGEPFATGQVSIAAPPAEIYKLVSDPTIMVEFAEEVVRASWLGGAHGPAVGARFKGHNRNGWRRWVTTCRITDAEPGRNFAFEVRTPFMVPISRWEYDIRPGDGGCTVVENCWLRVPMWFRPIANFITGQPDRAGTNNANIATTLGRLKAHLERA
ncbi:Polyketide cyclase / dehydrase and lipid transport [Amycolatopsis xylanica]|uniref:Polyketide cyclase / dehydrase and lipid transport n=1 Tax=Amycolatopsis xylanica TaxID=589385 RepID=A0A1H3G2C5_9PSEU|nr:SRPBCC family protein [Amycolatopsis xylanica]SDX97260.1 Polyketide cyclase / dehydrase and lipid transport [Amycolatopsis xylanica]